jgi:hypothetical protein
MASATVPVGLADRLMGFEMHDGLQG